jgi:hypothetical protein
MTGSDFGAAVAGALVGVALRFRIAMPSMVGHSQRARNRYSRIFLRHRFLSFAVPRYRTRTVSYAIAGGMPLSIRALTAASAALSSVGVRPGDGSRCNHPSAHSMRLRV